MVLYLAPCIPFCGAALFFRGPWTRAESTFSNEYFRLLYEEKWSPKTAKHAGPETHGAPACPWKGPPQFESADGTLMMLPSDLVLTKDPQFAEWALKYKADEDLFFKDFAAAFGKLLALGTVDAKAAASSGSGGGYWGQLKGLVGLK